MTLKYYQQYLKEKPTLRDLRQETERIEELLHQLQKKYRTLQSVRRGLYSLEAWNLYDFNSGTKQERKEKREQYYRDEFAGSPFFNEELDLIKMTRECNNLLNITIEMKNELVCYRWLTYPEIHAEQFYNIVTN